MKTMTAHGLAYIEIRPTADEEAFVLEMFDTARTATACVITPDALHVLLEPLLQLAVHWAEHKDLHVGPLLDPQQKRPAYRQLMKRGRNVPECVVHIFVGKVEWTFLIPPEKVPDTSTP